MQVLEELYLGGINLGERIGNHNRQYEKALENTIKVGDALTASLTPEQKELFENYMDAQREVNVLTDCDTFIYGFKLGAKIMMDVLTDGKMKEI